MAEFHVQTSNYSSEFGGNSGAVINVASKRGPNEFHGTSYEFVRRRSNARTIFSLTVDPLKQNQLGFVASGPVFIPALYDGKNKPFWDVCYEATRQRPAVIVQAQPRETVRPGRLLHPFLSIWPRCL
jgi:hypothetical protein